MIPASRTFPSSRPPVNLEGSRHESPRRQQPEAIAQRSPVTPRKFLQVTCGGAAKDATNLQMQLVCTEINGPVPCPAGTALGRGCAEYGPTDAWLVEDYGFMPACTDT